MPPTESARKGRAIGEENIQPLKTWDELEKMQQIAAKRLVHTSDANGNANASGSTSTSKHTCELPQRKCKCKHQRKKWKISHFFALAFVFHTCEPGQRKGKRKMKNTLSMPPRFQFKPRWHPPRWHLTESVGKHPVLSDKSCTGFREKLKKQVAWTGVAKD